MREEENSQNSLICPKSTTHLLDLLLGRKGEGEKRRKGEKEGEKGTQLFSCDLRSFLEHQ